MDEKAARLANALTTQLIPLLVLQDGQPMPDIPIAMVLLAQDHIPQSLEALVADVPTEYHMKILMGVVLGMVVALEAGVDPVLFRSYN